jgi:prevent-host-death family protein
LQTRGQVPNLFGRQSLKQPDCGRFAGTKHRQSAPRADARQETRLPNPTYGVSTSLRLVDTGARRGDPKPSEAKTVGAYEAKTHFSELLDRADAGEEITITKHGHPVAKLVPIHALKSVESRRAAIAKWKELSKGLSLGGLKIRDLIDEGRK